MLLTSVYVGFAAIIGLIALVREPDIPRHWPLLLIAAIPQAALIYGVEIPGNVIISAICIAGWGILDRATAGVPCIAGGMLLNLLAMAAHGGRMPIHSDLVTGAAGQPALGEALAGSKDVVVAGSPLLWLSDHIPISVQHITIIASPGDLIVIAGILWWMLRSTPAARSRDHAYTPPSNPAQDGAPAVSPRR